MMNTLAHGASEDEIKRTKDELGWQLHVFSMILYHFFYGQGIHCGGFP
jgi:hypothetical protein